MKKWSDFNKNSVNEKYKTFTGKKKDKVDLKPNVTRSGVSASSEYADDVNQNIVKQKKTKGTPPNRKYKTKKIAMPMKDKSIYPPENTGKATANMGEATNENVLFYGKIAKFPKDVKASNAFKWMHNLQDPKLAKKDIWYLMVEKQNNELQMVKYQQKNGVNLTKFLFDLKQYYTNKYKDNPKIVEQIKNIKLAGDDEGNISAIANIPNIKLEGKKFIRTVTEDLIKLLS